MTDLESRDYKDTLHLPQTDFPMKAGLPKREPEILAYWRRIGLYNRLRAAAEGREKYILHDGPPYANGDLHIGHALNKILKDVIVRARQMTGKDAIYVPGWDCHGLPIEWQIEAQYRAEGQSKEDVPPADFRAECRRFAEKWVGIQSEQFQRLGVVGDWESPYTTMDFAAEACIVAEFQKFIMDGSLYRGAKPVMWSVVEQTALAEAEVEYQEHVSSTIFVKFPVVDSDMSAVIWTTTPWTIPGNRAIAYAPDLTYGIYQAGGEKLILCDSLAERVLEAAELADTKRLGDAGNLDGLVCKHPFAGQGYEFDVRLYPADFVTDETGTGLVHIAPGHGQDDFSLGVKHEIPVVSTIDAGGVYLDDIPLFAGKRVLDESGKRGDADGAVIAALDAAGALLARGKLRHPYPHSWRSKAPLVFRTTPQWFISMSENGLRDKALAAIEKVDFVPPAGKNRIQSMVAERPDWVVSRQRAWGVPLTLFVHRESGEILRDEAVNARIVEAVREGGADVWFDTDPQEFLGEAYRAEDYEQVRDILDVWFDSGVTHAFVLETRPELQWPADLYLEGSDQHRGWFQSSLLEACATRGRAPFKAVLTHGFTMDEKGRKMSKSDGKALDPQSIIGQSGADIIRLWVASSDYREDTRIGADIIKANTDAYRKIRNCFRFLLGNLDGFNESERVEAADMPALERYILHELAVCDAAVRSAYDEFAFRKVYQTLFNFMTLDLSAFYFDIRKDTLYCDALSSVERRACRSVLDTLFKCLTTWFAPILAFTCEEVWQSRLAPEAREGDEGSVHLQQFPEIPDAWRDEDHAEIWRQIRRVRRVITGALEIERREKRIGSSLEAAPIVSIADADLHALLEAQPMADICITSQITLRHEAPPPDSFQLEDIDGIGITPAHAEGRKCRRSWKILPDVGSVKAYPDLSARDAAAVAEYDAQS